jgi:hypothetical protein
MVNFIVTDSAYQPTGDLWKQAREEYERHNDPQDGNSVDARYRLTWLELMLPRLKKRSHECANMVPVPPPAYHGSPFREITILDPTLGEGLGVWFTSTLSSAVHMAVDKSRRISTAVPTVYEAILRPNRTAVFEKEGDAYDMRVPYPDDDFRARLGNPFTKHEIREILASEGFDSIYIQQWGTFSAIVPGIITIKEKHNALVYFNTALRPEMEKRMGGAFESLYGFVDKLSL